MKAIGMTLLAAILAGGAPAINVQDYGAPGTGETRTAASGAYQLTTEIPATIRKGEVVTLILYVREGGLPVEKATACLATPPLFISVEDALDTTPIGGTDLGTGSESIEQPGCINSIAGVMSEPGTYTFTWEPDTAGRVNLTFTVGTTVLTVPVDVASAPPSAAFLIFFVLFVAAVLTSAAWLRRRRRTGGGTL